MKILHDKGNRSFFMRDETGKNVVEMSYEIKENVMIINKVFVNESLGKNDIGKSLIELGISFARKEGYLIDPQCEFAKKIIRQYYPDIMIHRAMT